MVSPVLYVAIPLAVAFLLPLLSSGRSHGSGRGARYTARSLQAATLAVVLATSLVWLRAFLTGVDPVVVSTGGWPPPIGINLRLGATEALLVALAAATGLGVAAHELLATAAAPSARDRRPTLELLLFVGAAGLIMTRDVFNMFVFIEIASIATYALAATGEGDRTNMGKSFVILIEKAD